MRSGLGGIRAAVVASAMCFAGTAHAADRIYVTNEGNDDALVSFANLDGSGGGALVPNLPGSFSDGVAIDAAAGRLYYGRSANTGDRISFVNLDGSGGGDLNTPGVTVDFPAGLAIDPAAGRLYWSNYGASQIAFARLDGSGAGLINTTGATVSSPLGVAIDPVGGRIYWANNSSLDPPIAFARLDGSGGDDLETTGASTGSALGVALDLAAGRVYWGNEDKISFARLDGSGGGDLPTPNATVSDAWGVTIDVPAGRIYWPNAGNDTISFAALDGSGGGNLNTAGASLGSPQHPALLKRPAGAGIPVISGGSLPGSSLSCSQGTWAPDLLGAHFYRVPSGFSFQWSRDGADLSGATSSSLAASEPGNYRCTVTASNAAGSSSQTSEPHVVAFPTFGSETLVTLTLAAKRIPAKGPVKVRVKNGNDFEVDGTLSGRTPKKVTVSRRKVVKLKAKAFSVGAAARKTVKLELPKPLRVLLKSKGKVKLRLVARVTDPAGNSRSVRRKVTPKLKAKKRKR